MYWHTSIVDCPMLQIIDKEMLQPIVGMHPLHAGNYFNGAWKLKEFKTSESVKENKITTKVTVEKKSTRAKRKSYIELTK